MLLRDVEHPGSPERALYRQVTCTDGTVDVEMVFEPRFDYARARTTLGERITVGEADEVGEQLPDELTVQLTHTADEAEEFSVEEFLGRVSNRTTAAVDPEHTTRAVFVILSEHVRDEELDNMTGQLPASYGEFLRDADIGEGAP